MINPISSPSPQKPIATSDSALSQLGKDYTQFVRLLTSQIQNQDPLNPMDSNQFVTQLAQLSQVEQSVKTNSNLTNIQSTIEGFATLSAANVLGRDATVKSDVMNLKNGVTHTAYELSAPAKEVVAEIRNETGKVVRKLTKLANESGKRIDLSWDGKDDAGNPLGDGRYTLGIQAHAADGSTVSASIFQTVKVKEFLSEKGRHSLTLSNGQNVSLSEILGLR